MNIKTDEFSDPTSVIANTYNHSGDEMPTITVEIMESWIPEPKHMTEGSAGVDIIASVKGTKTIKSGETEMISTGLKLGIPKGYFGMLVPRSGLASKSGIVLSNTIGIIDSDYRGELLVSLYNRSDKSFEIKSGYRIAQLLLVPFVSFNAVFEGVDNTERGDGGFGSTGVD
jgi:dUTP pyrophosphatase